MKIGITCYPTYGGSGVVATELGLELAERGHEIHFISYAQPIRLNRPATNIHYHEVEVSRYPLFGDPNGRGLGALRSRPSARALCDSALGQRHAGATDARCRPQPTQAAVRHHLAWDRHNPGGTRPLLF